MILFPYCKINLGLQILAKRPDGFHDLDTVFLPVKGWYDVLEILPAAQDEFTLSGAVLEGDPADNLVCRAREAMRRHLARQGRTLPMCRLGLHKAVPAGAGLGGGSSDATHTLIGLNRLFNLGLSIAEIEAMSRPLGSDCAFFRRARPGDRQGGPFGTYRLRNRQGSRDRLRLYRMPPLDYRASPAYLHTAGIRRRPAASRPAFHAGIAPPTIGRMATANRKRLREDALPAMAGSARDQRKVL